MTHSDESLAGDEVMSEACAGSPESEYSEDGEEVNERGGTFEQLCKAKTARQLTLSLEIWIDVQ